jgi:hypothetical protein
VDHQSHIGTEPQAKLLGIEPDNRRLSLSNHIDFCPPAHSQFRQRGDILSVTGEADDGPFLSCP